MSDLNNLYSEIKSDIDKAKNKSLEDLQQEQKVKQAEFQSLKQNINSNKLVQVDSQKELQIVRDEADISNLKADARYKDVSSWIKIIAAPTIYILIIIEVITIMFFVMQNLNFFESRDLAVIFGAILAQSFGVVFIVTRGLYSVNDNNDINTTRKEKSIET